MTIETKMVKPIAELNFDRLKEVVNRYREIENLLNNDGYLPFEIFVGDEFVFCDDWLQDEVIKLLRKNLEILESELNLLGYTFEDEPREWQYHVNVLRGEDDEETRSD